MNICTMLDDIVDAYETIITRLEELDSIETTSLESKIATKIGEKLLDNGEGHFVGVVVYQEDDKEIFMTVLYDYDDLEQFDYRPNLIITDENDEIKTYVSDLSWFPVDSTEMMEVYNAMFNLGFIYDMHNGV